MKILVKAKTFVSKQIIDIKNYGIKELLRKIFLLLNFFLAIPAYIFAIFSCIIIRLIRPWIIIRMEGTGNNFSSFVLGPAFLCCQKKFKIDLPTTKHIDFLYISDKPRIYNKQLAKMWKRKLNFLSGYLLDPITSYLLDPINKVNKFIPGWKVHELGIRIHKTGRELDKFTDKYQPLEFTNEEEIYGKKMLNKFGLKENDKFVCLAVRDSRYQLKKIPARFRDWSYHEYRNWDIDKFILAAEELAERGYYVFRIGVVVEKTFNSNNPKVIDYANSDLRSDFLDIYLGAKCSFCISTGLGFHEVPIIFRRPIILLANPLGSAGINHETALILCKHNVFKKDKRRLSLSEIFSHGVGYALDTRIYKEKGVELADNTPEEIRDVAIEMAENLEFKRQLNPKDEELQKTFRSLLALNIKRYSYHTEVKAYCDYRGPIRFRYSTKFLRENKNWLK